MERKIPDHLQGQDVTYCGTCKQWKQRQDFHKDASRKSGVSARCKACKAAWGRANSARLSQIANEWRLKNPERSRQNVKAWKKRNPDAPKKYIQASNKKQEERIKNDPVLLEKRREQKRQWARRWGPSRKAASAAKWQKRKARLLGCGGSYTAEEWNDLCMQFGNRCLCCGEMKSLTADHVIPLALGGLNTIENIQPLCRSCNSRKGVKVIDYRIKGHDGKD